jgi:hypothetical protein
VARQTDVPPALMSQLAGFLAVREMSLYGVIHTFLDLNDLDWFPARFMLGRRERVEADVPFPDLDFEGVWRP